MANPAGLTYAKVVANYLTFIGDTGDADDLPDAVPFEGSAVITPDLLEVHNITPGTTGIYFPGDIECSVVDGVLQDAQGHPYVMLLAAGPGLTSEGFTYSIRLSLRPVGETEYKTYGPYSFEPVPDLTTGVVDLAVVTPVASSGGTPVIVGPPGPANLVISPTDPGLTIPGMWIQTGLGDNGDDFSIWIEDGL